MEKLTHRRKTNELKTGYITMFAEEREHGGNQHYGSHVWTLRTELPRAIDSTELVAFTAEYFDVQEDEAEDLLDVPAHIQGGIVNDGGAWEDPAFVSEVWERFKSIGYRTDDGAVVLDLNAVELDYHVESDDDDEE